MVIKYRVAILVLVDNPFGELGYLGLCAQDSQVAILVLVDNPFGELIDCLYMKQLLVAILVLVDNPFGEATSRGQELTPESRNPCSSG